MSDYTTRYFQLTSDILIEYNYASDKGTGGTIDVLELEENRVISTLTPNMRFYLINKNFDNINLTESKFVVPTNNSQTTFIKLLHNLGLTPTFDAPVNKGIIVGEPFTYNDNINNKDNLTCTLKFDKLRFHFTGRNFMSGYDGLIFQLYVYDKNKRKICLMSNYLSKTDTPIINDNPMLINQKYYTSYTDVKIPSVYNLLKSYKDEDITIGKEDKGSLIAYKILKTHLGILDNQNQLMTNTPIMINVFGIKHILKKDGYETYLTENISSISIPSKDSYDDIYVDIHEAEDGDYFNISTKISDGTSFSDYISKLDEHPESFVILHELKLIEHYVTYDNKIAEDISHVEQYIVNAAVTYLDEHDNNQITINSEGLDRVMTYRPICRRGSQCFKFTIVDNLKIINTNDNTTIVKKGTYTYDNPSKYGKKMKQINLTDIPSTINVYNKRTDGDVDMDNTVIHITNGGSGSSTKIETTTQKITAFYEGTNIVCSIQQIPAAWIETTT